MNSISRSLTITLWVSMIGSAPVWCTFIHLQVKVDDILISNNVLHEEGTELFIISCPICLNFVFNRASSGISSSFSLTVRWLSSLQKMLQLTFDSSITVSNCNFHSSKNSSHYSDGFFLQVVTVVFVCCQRQSDDGYWCASQLHERLLCEDPFCSFFGPWLWIIGKY